jgi:hypothetical protein
MHDTLHFARVTQSIETHSPLLIKMLLAAPAKRAYAGVQLSGYRTIKNALQSGAVMGFALLECGGLAATAAAITRVPQNPQIYQDAVTIFALLVSALWIDRCG